MKRIVFISFLLFLLLLFVPLIACMGSMNPSVGAGSSLSPVTSSDPLTSQNQGSDQSPDRSELLGNSEQKRFIIYDLSSGENLSLTETDYLFGAVASEMPASYGEEALKAQAIACYTMALRSRIAESKNPTQSLNGAHFTCDLSKSYGYITEEKLKERWGDDFDKNHDKIMQAIQDVAGKVMAYDNQPILAAYHAMSNGTTEKAGVFWQTDMPYLQSVESSFDKDAENYHTQVTYTKDEITDVLKKQYSDFKYNPSDSLIEIVKTSEAGNVTSAYAGNIELTGSELRTLLNLRSSTFKVTESADSVTFDVYGYGHGVGMSQYGAGYLAQEGKSYEEILNYYYTDIDIVDADQLSA